LERLSPYIETITQHTSEADLKILKGALDAIIKSYLDF
jgi:hypothetical protein